MRIHDGDIRATLIDILILLVCGLTPVLVAQFTSARPSNRFIHIESFRYGKEPSSIFCNRGDTLHLTFSSRDTGHSFFLQEFDLDVKVSPSSATVLQFRASDPEQPAVERDTVVFVAEHPGLLKFLVSKSVFRCHVWCGPMHAFEAGNLVIRPNTLLNGGLGLLVGLFLVGLRRGRFTKPDKGEGQDLLSRFPWIRNVLKRPWVMPAVYLCGGLVLYLIVLMTVFGTQVSGRNLGVMLVWTVWLFVLVTFFTPFGGRLWCMVCPLPAVGDALQRRSLVKVRTGSTGGSHNQFFGLQRDWPRWLSGHWPRLMMFLVAGTFSTTLVAQPRTTGYAIVFLFVMGSALSMVFKLRSFCRFLCPINSFIATYAQIGSLSLRKINEGVCEECRGAFCETGSHTGWACPYGLNVKTITTNVDCGLCTECIRSCVYDNVTVRVKPFGGDAHVSDAGMAWNGMALLVVGIAYTIVYLGPWPEIRDYVNIIDKGNWGLFALYAAALWFTALVIFPMAMFVVTSMSRKLSGVAHRARDLMVRSSGALLPLGLSIWVAFALQMLFTNVTFIEQSLNDPFGWGWNLFGMASIPWVQFLPRLVPWLQVLCVTVGMSYSQQALWRIWLRATGNYQMALRGVVPLGLFMLCIAGGLVWFYAS